ncbi:glycoside hydrolase family 43 protein [Paenibacillus agricola]|uniref:Family 43 glycosylhydrolase n=1 Tax=Paenibacillus agricola TaxID=2716264 RepID=A0ABX0JED2_9BACL|nr:glycoside hydrolase family 43 protein [Paenibacillus agricola]NHN33760.1 family 43 glycosylhydrolase [Paenibacillus agricola]
MLENKEVQIRDPFILPVASEGKYYMYGSTDTNIWGKGTGFNVYVGDDLQRWEGPYPVFRPDSDFFSDTNFWAPEVYAYGDRYYMFATFRRKDNELLGTAVLAADSPLGPFKPHSEGPVTPESWSSLDGTLFIDEQGSPWMVFCHEWQQVADGEVCAMRLSDDLKGALGEPVVLFRASEAPWTTPYVAKRYPDQDNYVTDGPFLFRSSSNQLFMLWAGFIENKYALGIAKSSSGRITGPWVHEEQPLYRNDGGHGMIFRTLDGQLKLTIHAPNQTPDERPLFLNISDNGDAITLING